MKTSVRPGSATHRLFFSVPLPRNLFLVNTIQFQFLASTRFDRARVLRHPVVVCLVTLSASTSEYA